jgi:hypothetical protein
VYTCASTQVGKLFKKYFHLWPVKLFISTKGRAEQSVRTFGAYTAQLDELVQWFKDCELKPWRWNRLGVYWIPLCQKLEEAGFEDSWSTLDK